MSDYKGTERRGAERRRDTRTFRTRPKSTGVRGEKRAKSVKGDKKIANMYDKLDL